MAVLDRRLGDVDRDALVGMKAAQEDQRHRQHGDGGDNDGERMPARRQRVPAGDEFFCRLGRGRKYRGREGVVDFHGFWIAPLEKPHYTRARAPATTRAMP